MMDMLRRSDDMEIVEPLARGALRSGDEEVVDALIKSRSRLVDSPIASLTPRELDVLAEIASGKNNAGVAEALSVSEHAVEKHTNAIFAKLGLTGDDEINRRVKAVLLFLAGQGQHQT